MHVREHCGNGASFGGRLGSPGCRIKVLNESLIHAVIGGKSLAAAGPSPCLMGEWRAEELFGIDLFKGARKSKLSHH
jgi:hypothetical protein